MKIYPELFINPKFDKKATPERPGDQFFFSSGAKHNNDLSDLI
jgi:hypothetical protein